MTPADVAQALPEADTWGTDHSLGAAWWIPMIIVMVLFCGAMMLVGGRLMRGGMNCGPWQRSPTEPPASAETSEAPLQVLDRRFAEERSRSRTTKHGGRCSPTVPRHHLGRLRRNAGAELCLLATAQSRRFVNVAQGADAICVASAQSASA